MSWISGCGIGRRSLIVFRFWRNLLANSLPIKLNSIRERIIGENIHIYIHRIERI